MHRPPQIRLVNRSATPLQSLDEVGSVDIKFLQSLNDQLIKSSVGKLGAGYSGHRPQTLQTPPQMANGIRSVFAIPGRVVYTENMRPIPLLVLLWATNGSASALESWGLPDMSQDDKKLHAGMGFVAAAVTDLAIKTSHPELPKWARYSFDILSATVTGIAIEWVQQQAMDGRGPSFMGRSHDVDPRDSVACLYGGGLYVAFTWTWEF